MMNFGHEDSVVKAGWLTKLGGNAIRKTWKRRWFVLKGNNLYYYRDQNCKEASGMVNLSLYNSISQDTTVTKKSQYCIRIEKVVKESDSTHCNLGTYHHDVSSPSSSPSTSSIFSTPVSIIPSSKHSYKISRSPNNNNNNNNNNGCKDNNNNNVFSARSSLTTLKKPLTFVVFTDDENDMEEWMILLEKCLGGRNIVDIVLDRLDLANIGMHKRQGSYSSLRSFYSKNSSFCSSNGSTTTNSNISSRRPSLDSSSFDTLSLDSRKSSMDSFRGNQNTVTSHMMITTMTNGGNGNVSSHQSISRPETPSNLIALFGIGQPILRKPASHGCLQDRRNDIINDTNHKSANSSISSTSSSINDIIINNNNNNNNNDKDFNTNVHNITSSSTSSTSSSLTMTSINDIKSSNRIQSTPLIMVHNESSKIIPSSPEIINSNDDEDFLATIDKN